ncbi:MAG: bacillithiol biosynthesis deacetylase BshB1 [Planctomycetota bacterium]|nr:MAG: bacillithiol biosynthesis deacetylase BshB1 [Planctomycetota bacterium]
MERVLLVSPHPDDAELAMGGTIAKMIDAGWDVTIVDLTDGEPTPFGSKQLREKEAGKASMLLGVKNRMCLEMPNRYLQVTLENRRKLAEVIRLNKPDLLFGPAMPDYHPDHIATAELTSGARFEAKFHKTNMAAEPHWASRKYDYYSTHRLTYDKPSFVVDVTDYWDKKMNAVRAYQSQIKNISPPNAVSLVEKVEVVGRYFGQCAGFKYGEPFVGYEAIPVKNIKLLVTSP